MSEMNLEDKLCKNLEDSCIKAYKAGQQSMQTEIEFLKAQLSLQRDRNKALETELIGSRNYGDGLQKQIDDLEKYQRINGECINNLVNEKLNYLNKITMAIAHLDSFDHSRAGMNKLIRSIESALEALRGERE